MTNGLKIDTVERRKKKIKKWQNYFKFFQQGNNLIDIKKTLFIGTSQKIVKAETIFLKMKSNTIIKAISSKGHARKITEGVYVLHFLLPF